MHHLIFIATITVLIDTLKCVAVASDALPSNSQVQKERAHANWNRLLLKAKLQQWGAENPNDFESVDPRLQEIVTDDIRLLHPEFQWPDPTPQDIKPTRSPTPRVELDFGLTGPPRTVPSTIDNSDQPVLRFNVFSFEFLHWMWNHKSLRYLPHLLGAISYYWLAYAFVGCVCQNVFIPETEETRETDRLADLAPPSKMEFIYAVLMGTIWILFLPFFLLSMCAFNIPVVWQCGVTCLIFILSSRFVGSAFFYLPALFLISLVAFPSLAGSFMVGGVCYCWSITTLVTRYPVLILFIVVQLAIAMQKYWNYEGIRRIERWNSLTIDERRDKLDRFDASHILDLCDQWCCRIGIECFDRTSFAEMTGIECLESAHHYRESLCPQIRKWIDEHPTEPLTESRPSNFTVVSNESGQRI